MRIPGNVLAWLFVTICALTFVYQAVHQLRVHVFPPDDAYFEAYLNRKFSGYRKMEGRTLKCETDSKDEQGYYVDCQFFRNGIGEEHTYQWFEPNGDYISSLDGG